MSSDQQHETLWFAIALKSPDGSHCGIVYESEREGQKYLHFAWDGDLRREAVSPQRPLRLIETDITETNKKALALLAEDIYAHNNAQNIRYSLDSLGVEFDVVTHEFRSAGIGTGLSCATFVVAVMQRAGFTMVDVMTWRSDQEDARIKAWVIAQLEQQLGSQDPHVEAMRRQEKLFRIRPADVVGAGSVPNRQWPVNFDIARSEGVAILQAMNAASRSGGPAATT